MTSGLTITAESVCEAIRRHVAAIEGTTEDRAPAGAALVEALNAYGLAVVNTGSKLPDEYDSFDGWLDEEDGVEHREVEDLATDETTVVGCFLRVDLGLPGEHRPETYNGVSERLQNLLQEAILETADGGPKLIFGR